MEKEKKYIIPPHIAFIMDGNGRWARNKGLPRTAGHVEGVKTVERIIDFLCREKIRCATFYTFSTENWGRPAEEIKVILSLLDNYLDNLYQKYISDPEKYSSIEFRFIGDLSAFSEKIQKKIERIVLLNPPLPKVVTTICIAINYGGRNDIVQAVNRFVSDNPGKEITEDAISNYSFLAGLPDADLIIRTAGEYRLSNFLTWQSIYSEYYSVETLWPDFDVPDLLKAVEVFNNRTRKFGKIISNEEDQTC